jgi:hypothetical protein
MTAVMSPAQRAGRLASERAWNRQVDDSAGPAACWPWRGAPTPDGYGRFGKSPQMAHCVAYERAVGPIPKNLVIDHLCRNRICVNPAHLQPVRQRTNLLRSPLTLPSQNLAKTHCPRGHEYTPINTYLRVKPGGLQARECRTCRRMAGRRAAA